MWSDIWGEHGLMSDGWALMGFTMLASTVVLIAAAWWFIELVAGWPWRDRDHPVRDEIERLGHRHDDALRTLDERLARGEIDPEEFRTRRRALTEDDGAT